jgi:succinate dehydrogenase flavin-adding protein (antitoxin of CptAB toxin-antitoxin module)
VRKRWRGRCRKRRIRTRKNVFDNSAEKRQKINLTSEVKTQNKYDPLSDHEDTDLVECRMDEGEVEEVPQTEELKKEKTSPIILHGNFGAKKLLEFCKHGTKNQVLLKFTRNNMIILAEIIESVSPRTV